MDHGSLAAAGFGGPGEQRPRFRDPVGAQPGGGFGEQGVGVHRPAIVARSARNV